MTNSAMWEMDAGSELTLLHEKAHSFQEKVRILLKEHDTEVKDLGTASVAKAMPIAEGPAGEGPTEQGPVR